jgi:poly-gamma-glutamate capsule biosynthesis protein CapA/YwtB (metallophosphatase superfamily)
VPCRLLVRTQGFFNMNRTRLALSLGAVAMAGILWWQPWSGGPATVRGSGDVLTIAATGDSLLLKPIPSAKSNPDLERVATLLRGASLAVTNLEENLLDARPGEVRLPYGGKGSARDVRALGFTTIALANNHAIDYGVDGLSQTAQILDRAGLLHAGAGDDLAQAGAPEFAGSAPRRVAMIAVATSASQESRATPLRGEILGRPGVNALRYSPEVAADAATFATLQGSPAAATSKPGDNQLTVSGKTIKKGPRTVVEMVADEGDTKRILAQIRQARAKADYVIVMVHSHEPSNRSQAPAEFLKVFARAAVDAGAMLVIGHGPHQLRGIEVYEGGVIFYSLGNFLSDLSQVDARSEDDYDAGMDLYRLALGAVGDSEQPPQRQVDNALWWESVIAVGRFDRGVLRSVRLQPIDLGVQLPFSERGTPRFANAERSREILDRLIDLSREFGTQIRIDNGTGVIDLPEQNR